MRMPRLFVRTAAGVLTVVLVLLSSSSRPAGADTTHLAVVGSGSSWAANAINQWVADVNKFGLKVVFTSKGSALGRTDFANSNTDFGVSDIGFQGQDSRTGQADSSSRKYAYLPVAGGGTAFPYQIKVNGKLITNLRLSGLTLAKIFTNQITNWNDPAITQDNNGRQLPSKPIIPVVHSEGAGSTAQFTRYLATVYPQIWTAFNGSPKFSEYFTAQKNTVAQSGSDGVMSYVLSGAGDGTIGYDEYSYALSKGYPVAKLQNSAGYYTLPTQYNDAVALTQASINMDKSSPDYLLQTLDKVYTYGDPRTYPLSSYSYAIIPTAANDGRMSTGKRQTIADFLLYSVCAGQAEMGPIGYSALPLNLVQASMDQLSELHTADPAVDISAQSPSKCNNPTFDPANPGVNHLAAIAPQPQACDKTGAGPCDDTTGSAKAANATAGGGAGGAGRSVAKAATPKAAVGAGTGTAAGAAGGAPTASGATAAIAAGGPDGSATAVDPDTGAAVVDQVSGAGSDVAATPTDLASFQRAGNKAPLAVLIAVLLLLVLIAPPLVSRQLASRPPAQRRLFSVRSADEQLSTDRKSS